MESTHETWDLATSVGATATMVAAGRARATTTGLIDDRFAEPLVRAVGIDFMTRWATGDLAAADVDIPGATWGMQQMTDLLAARTRYFDAFFGDAAAAGVRQAVILASGLDARGYRLDWPAGTVLFEIDMPDVLEFKGRALTDLRAEPTAEVRMVAVDLRDDWPAALRAKGFDPTRPTAWSAEGLLPFLPPEAQDRLLDAITSLSASGSRLAAEVALLGSDSEDGALGADGARDLEPLLARWREHGFDLDLGDLGNSGPRNDVDDYLEARGWTSTRTPLAALLDAAGLEVPRPADGRKSLSDNYYSTAIKG
ncbi:class I SAM-dependent methyltransferase [Mycolicibacterium smegmatis]|uniref:Putative S-adenosyl-L-methionine-dependent methyltransferase MSMEG_1888/MSMEI_1848 n=2 Tax=Mycobacteriaceae TaxID=1762 RepID=Y1888_MYCS2|nr:class I SAM-dependent methyltransferase [Mycolicibacterium smegmatis]A0QTL6.1 RecName: Full=Putative S-adenosyl-L-methionine-dependent methyltransferase MSMEG_1888/MSMEI_1848 [Mycolicibacterium smegmatis MC2 155]ABK71680.1 methyltransferase [Mycolicibacterium smegmatis MC2 155]AFP38320.1 O-methyltransferase [Mycolicibacterium smegmatis MC2 155]AIU07110.1 SAM-dependent methyltransferase [Mycolicibacterium smegmatis MC2 155]AIU13735.1 SAM-dependent methyltransferase [Mycolicibacterium smegmat